ncbi:MAG: RNA pseudouridine synthase [Desulfuromonas sp.]|mgnify:CR=1 FL=1|nr:MAG: RNA pseudouridine synthase [Desulfuromonas sp.]
MFTYAPPRCAIPILYCDRHLLVVDKPADLLSVPGRKTEHKDSLVLRMMVDYNDVRVVHRLDMSTSGLMVLARNADAQRHLSRQFEQRTVKKSYLAIVSGALEKQEGRIDLPLIGDWPNRPRQKVDHAAGKTAITLYQSLSYHSKDDTSLVQLRPVTGRTHQLRVHMQSIGHAILGDDLYADDTIRDRTDRLMLHASGISFIHPANERPLSFNQPPPF